MKKYDFGEGWKATMEKTSSGYIELVMYAPTYRFAETQIKTMHINEADAMKEILSYFGTEED